MIKRKKNSKNKITVFEVHNMMILKLSKQNDIKKKKKSLKMESEGKTKSDEEFVIFKNQIIHNYI
jgi:hypothetical protein